jgi:hypothetical protein
VQSRTAFGRGAVCLTWHELCADLFQQIIAAMTDEGFQRLVSSLFFDLLILSNGDLREEF